MAYETVAWPRIDAKWKGGKRGRTTLIVIHTTEYPERATAAEDIARYFASIPAIGKKASSHIVVDNLKIIQCVPDSLEAYAAGPTGNSLGIHIELAGYARQSAAEWRDLYSNALLAHAADAVAQYALKYNLPIVRLTDDQLRNGRPGIVGHAQISAVWRESDHTDPGPDFPWMRLIAWARASYEERRAEINGRPA